LYVHATNTHTPIHLVPASEIHANPANIHMYTHIHKYTYANIHVHMKQIHTPIHMVPVSELHANADADEIYTYIYVCVYVYTRIHAYIQATQTDTAQTQTHIHIHYANTHVHTHRYICIWYNICVHATNTHSPIRMVPASELHANVDSDERQSILACTHSPHASAAAPPAGHRQ